MAAVVEIKYFNTFLLKKVFGDGTTPIWGGSFGIPVDIGGGPNAAITPSKAKEWVIEESRIQGGYNNSTVDFGVKAYIAETDTEAAVRASSLIYSGVYNSRTGINNTNQFSVGEEITKSLDPVNGSVQKLYAEDTNLVIFQENKVSRALIDKDAIYSAEGAGTLTSSTVVIGQVQAYAGNYGISKDPGSFAVYGYRKYFTDRYRNAVLRLSQDGITEISQYGMTDFFRDEFDNIDTASYGPGVVIGGWDPHNKQYMLSTQKSMTNPDTTYNTLSFSEESSGFTSFYSYKPSHFVDLKNKFYTLKDGKLWEHYNKENNTRCNFYGVQYSSLIRLVLNESPSNVKIFKTINYEGANGWQVDSFTSDFTGPDYINGIYTVTRDTSNEILTYNATVGTVSGSGPYTATITPTIAFSSNLLSAGDTIYSTPGTSSFITGTVVSITISASNITSFIVSSVNIFTSGSISLLYTDPDIFSYNMGAYDNYGNAYPSVLYPPLNRAGFDRKENKYMAALINKSEPSPGEISFGKDISGIKGYFAVVNMSIDSATDTGGVKELFSVSSNYDYSTY